MKYILFHFTRCNKSHIHDKNLDILIHFKTLIWVSRILKWRNANLCKILYLYENRNFDAQVYDVGKHIKFCCWA